MAFAQTFALALGAMTCLVRVSGRIFHGQNDFVGLYMGGVLANTSHLYSFAENRVLMNRLVHLDIDGISFVRPPFYAVILQPLALLPYPVAYRLFQSAMAAALVWFAWRFWKECPKLPVYVLFAPAVLICLSDGQDTPLFLIVTAFSILLFRKGRHFTGGLALALCAVKVHLFLFIPVLLLIKRRWYSLAGIATGGFLLFALGVAGAGLRSYRDWTDLIRSPAVTQIGPLTNLQVLVDALHGGVALEIVLVLAVIALFTWMCHKTEDFEFLFGVALVAGLLINAHSFPYDGVLLLLAIVLIKDKKLRLALSALLTPIAYVLLLWSKVPYVTALLATVILAAVSPLVKPVPEKWAPAENVSDNHGGGGTVEQYAGGSIAG